MRVIDFHETLVEIVTIARPNPNGGLQKCIELQGKGDMVWENSLGHQIRGQRVTMMAKSEMNMSNDKERMMWAERTHWNTWSECEGR